MIFVKQQLICIIVKLYFLNSFYLGQKAFWKFEPTVNLNAQLVQRGDNNIEQA